MFLANSLMFVMPSVGTRQCAYLLKTLYLVLFDIFSMQFFYVAPFVVFVIGQ
jgi:hypothetical protein